MDLFEQLQEEAKMKIAAKPADSFQRAHNNMSAVEEKNNKKRAKELKPINHQQTSNSFGRQKCTPVTVTSSKRNLPFKASVPAKEPLSSSLSSFNIILPTAEKDYRQQRPSFNRTSHISTNNISNSNKSSTKRPYEATNDLDPIVKKKRRMDRSSDNDKKTDSYLSSHNFPINQSSNSVVNGRHSHSNIHQGTSGLSPYTYLNEEESDYLREYTSITTCVQRNQYKADFNRIYKTYLEVYQFMEPYNGIVDDLDNILKKEERGSEEYYRTKQEIIRIIQATKDDKIFQNNKNEFIHLHKKIMHIKQLVTDYDKRPCLIAPVVACDL